MLAYLKLCTKNTTVVLDGRKSYTPKYYELKSLQSESIIIHMEIYHN